MSEFRAVDIPNQGKLVTGIIVLTTVIALSTLILLLDAAILGIKDVVFGVPLVVRVLAEVFPLFGRGHPELVNKHLRHLEALLLNGVDFIQLHDIKVAHVPIPLYPSLFHS